jgi:cytochrome P450 family 78 subfamily A
MKSTQLMAFSIGSTPAVVSSDPLVAKEILTHPCFADRPIKRSARELMFARAIGFAPNGTYWRMLRRIASTHLFAPRRIAAHEPGRQFDCCTMLAGIKKEMASSGSVQLRYHLQGAALNNIMGSVFSKCYDLSEENANAEVLKQMVREGFDLLGAFNWSDHLPWLAKFFDPSQVKKRCGHLVPRVRNLVSKIIDEHRKVGNGNEMLLCDKADFVDVLLSLEGDDKLSEDDMVAILWVCINFLYLHNLIILSYFISFSKGVSCVTCVCRSMASANVITSFFWVYFELSPDIYFSFYSMMLL